MKHLQTHNDDKCTTEQNMSGVVSYAPNSSPTQDGTETGSLVSELESIESEVEDLTQQPIDSELIMPSGKKIIIAAHKVERNLGLSNASLLKTPVGRPLKIGLRLPDQAAHKAGNSGLSLVSLVKTPHVKTLQRNYACVDCKRTFPNMYALNGHKKYCYKRELPFECMHCYHGMYATNNDLIEHIRLNHLWIACAKCRNVFPSVQEFKSKEHPCHISKSIDSMHTFRCIDCSAIFLNQEKLEKHLATRCCSRLTGVCCLEEECQEKRSVKFKCTCSFLKHLKRRHIGKDPRQLSTGMTLAIYELIVDWPFSNDPPQICGRCGKVCATKDHMVQHIVSVHSLERYTDDLRQMDNYSSDDNIYSLTITKTSPNGPLLFKCNLCSAKYSTEHLIKQHLKVMHSPESTKKMLRPRMPFHRNYTCVKCQDIFPSASSLIHHELSCFKTANIFQCIHCYLSFLSKDDILGHVRQSHVWIRCVRCTKVFQSTKEFEVHMSNKHPNIEEKDTGAPTQRDNDYKCIDCSAIFLHQEELENHLLTKCTLQTEPGGVCCVRNGCHQFAVQFKCSCSLLSHIRKKHMCASEMENKVTRVSISHTGSVIPSSIQGDTNVTQSAAKPMTAEIDPSLAVTELDVETSGEGPADISAHTKPAAQTEPLAASEIPIVEDNLTQHPSYSACHPCTECKAVFESTTAFNYHKMMFCPSKPVPRECVHCYREFEMKDDLLKHIRFNHMWIACANCRETFCSHKDFEEHKSKVHPNNNDYYNIHGVMPRDYRYICMDCHRLFVHSGYLETHLMTKCTMRLGEIRCETCRAKFKCKCSLLQHRISNNGGKDCILRVESECMPDDTFSPKSHGKGCTDESDITLDTASNHSSDTMPNSVKTVQDKGDSNESNLGQNDTGKRSKESTCSKLKQVEPSIKLEGPTEEECHKMATKCSTSFRCDSCETTFDSDNTLRAHIKHKHILGMGIPKTPGENYDCLYCKNTFSSLIDLSHHSIYCLSREKFKCLHCESSYTFPSDLLKHIRQNHIWFQCAHCNHLFQSKEKLKCHARTRHSAIPLDSDHGCYQGPMKDGNYFCVDCDTAFETRRQLQDHLITKCSDNIAEVQCKKCNSRFKCKCSLLQHTKRYHSKISHDGQKQEKKRKNRKCSLIEQTRKYHSKICNGQKKKSKNSTQYSLSEKNPSLWCAICEQMYCSEIDLAQHKAYVHSANLNTNTESSEQLGDITDDPPKDQGNDDEFIDVLTVDSSPGTNQAHLLVSDSDRHSSDISPILFNQMLKELEFNEPEESDTRNSNSQKTANDKNCTKDHTTHCKISSRCVSKVIRKSGIAKSNRHWNSEKRRYRRRRYNMTKEAKVCTLCHKTFSKRYLGKHIREKCDKTLLRKHILREHNYAIKIEQSYARRKLPHLEASLSYWLTDSTGCAEAGKFRCLVCNRAHASHISLVRHMRRMHIGQEFYKCSLCAKQFSTRESQREHIKVHAPNRGLSMIQRARNELPNSQLKFNTLRALFPSMSALLCKRKVSSVQCRSKSGITKHNMLHCKCSKCVEIKAKKRNVLFLKRRKYKMYLTKKQMKKNRQILHFNKNTPWKLRKYTVLRPYSRCLMCLHWYREIEQHLLKCKANRPCLKRIIEIYTEIKQEPIDGVGEYKQAFMVHEQMSEGLPKSLLDIAQPASHLYEQPSLDHGQPFSLQTPVENPVEVKMECENGEPQNANEPFISAGDKLSRITHHPQGTDEPPTLTPEQYIRDDGPPLLTAEHPFLENEQLSLPPEPPVLDCQLPFAASKEPTDIDEAPILACEQPLQPHETHKQALHASGETLVLHGQPFENGRQSIEGNRTLESPKEVFDIKSETTSTDKEILGKNTKSCEDYEKQSGQLKVELGVLKLEVESDHEQQLEGNQQLHVDLDRGLIQNQEPMEIKVALPVEESIEAAEHSEVVQPNSKVQKVKASRQCMMCLDWFHEIEEHLWMCQAKRPCLNRMHVVKVTTDTKKQVSQAQRKAQWKGEQLKHPGPKQKSQNKANDTKNEVHAKEKCLMCLGHFNDGDIVNHLWTCQAKRHVSSKMVKALKCGGTTRSTATHLIE